MCRRWHFGNLGSGVNVIAFLLRDLRSPGFLHPHYDSRTTNTEGDAVGRSQRIRCLISQTNDMHFMTLVTCWTNNGIEVMKQV